MPTGPNRGTAPSKPFQLWSFREDVHIELGPDDGTATLHSRWGEVTVQGLGRMASEVLRRMSLGPISLENVLGEYAEEPGERVRLSRLLNQLQYLVIRSFGIDSEQPLISVVPLTPQARFRPVMLSPDRPVRLSRFALLRTDGNTYCLESPLAMHRVMLHRAESLWLIGALGSAITPAAAAAASPHASMPIMDALSYLSATEMVVRAEPAAPGELPAFAEDADPVLAAWSPIDLMFHTRSTLGRHDHDFGATYPLGEPYSPEPVVKPARGGAGISLYRPRLEKLLAADPPLTVAVEGRRSTRDYGAEPLRARELGELLYRTARVRSLVDSPDPDKPLAQLSDRPYPSGGASYELELYVTVSECADIPRGTYHYDPLGHRLEPVNADAAAVDELLDNGRMAGNLAGPPPVLITMTARFRRLSWKYRGLTYAMALKDVGVMMQTLYLVSTAMGLAACALGSSDIHASARAFGTDWRTESSIGEFVIGRRPERGPDRSQGRHPANDAAWADRAAARIARPGGGTGSSSTA